MMKASLEKLLNGDAEVLARRLLGSLISRETDGQILVGKIVETEAYDQTDAASHSYHGKTPRIEVMFGPAGRAYVYFTYGMHHCFNVVVGPEGRASAVLIRAIEPLKGQEVMKFNRKNPSSEINLTNGPAKFCQAFLIDRRLNGHDLSELPLKLELKPSIKNSEIITTTRIGISRDIDRPWRFYIKDNPYVSKI